MNGSISTLMGGEGGKGFDMGKRELAALTAPPKFDNVDDERRYLKETLVAAIRIFAKYDLDHTIAGHLTVRDVSAPGEPISDNFWVNPFGLAFALMTVSDLILVNHKGDVIGGGKPGRQIVNLAGFTIHSAIHTARPDVNVIMHSHSVYGKAYSSLGIPLEITTQDACVFYNDCALLADFGGVVIESKEGASITNALQQKKAIILQNHGILTVGTTIGAALAWFIMLEKQCQVLLLANGKGKTITPAEAAFTYRETGHERAGFFLASPYFQVIEAEQGEAYKK